MKKITRKRIRILKEMIRLKTIRDELIKEKNSGRKKYLLFRLGVTSLHEYRLDASCEISGGWKFYSLEDFNDYESLGKQVYSFLIERLLEAK